MEDIQKNGKLASYREVPQSVKLHPISFGELYIFTNMSLTPLSDPDSFTCDSVTQFMNSFYSSSTKKHYFYTPDVVRPQSTQPTQSPSKR